MQIVQLPRTPDDGRRYWLSRAPTGLLCLLISDPAAEAASCVAQFGVGSHDEPQTLPGLAHLLEHMLFMGSARYPQAGSFPQLVSEWSGRFNASTAAERTRYHFSVNPAGLGACLAQLTDMLAAPLFLPETVAAERQVIDAEFHTRLADDALHEQAVLGQALNPAHPLSRFSAGNLSSLGVEPAALAQALRQFHGEHYRAANGCLVIHAPLPLEQLLPLAGGVAEQLPAAAQKPGRSSQPLFAPQSRPRLLRWQNRSRHGQWLLLFPLDDVDTAEGAKALRWLCEWLASPAPAGGLGWLRAQGLVAELKVGAQRYAGRQTLLRIELEPLIATSDYPALLDGFFSWLAALRATPTQGWPQAARQQLADQAFNNGPQGEPLRWLTALAERTLYEPPELILESTGQWAGLCEQAWQGLMDQLQPEHLLLVQSQSDSTGLSQQTPWTQTRFVSSRLNCQPAAVSSQTLAAADWPIWHVAEPEITLRERAGGPLPGLRTIPVADPAAPAPGQGREVTRFGWCWPGGSDRQQRDKLKALWSLQLEPLENWAHASGITWLWRDEAGLISLELHGPAQSLWTGVAAAIAALTQQPELAVQRLADHRYQRQRHEQRHALPAYRLLEELEHLLSSLPTQAGSNVEDIYPEQAQMAWLYPESWLHQKRDTIIANLQKNLPQLGQAFAWQAPAARPLEEGTETLYVDCFHADRAQILYCQAGASGPSERAYWQLLQQQISASFFDQLRTRQQLGYWVVARRHEVAGMPGLFLLVQSPTHDHDQIEAAMAAWLESERARLAQLPFEQLQLQAQRLAKHLRTQSESPTGQLELDWARALELAGATVKEQCAALDQLTPERWQQTVHDWLERPRRLHLVSRPA